MVASDVSHILDHVFFTIGMNNAPGVSNGIPYPVLVSEPPLNPRYSRHILHDMFLNCYRCPSVSVVVPELCIAQYTQMETGAVVHLGHEDTTILPVHTSVGKGERGCDWRTVTRLPIGGKAVMGYVCDRMQQMYLSPASRMLREREAERERLHEEGTASAGGAPSLAPSTTTFGTTRVITLSQHECLSLLQSGRVIPSPSATYFDRLGEAERAPEAGEGGNSTTQTKSEGTTEAGEGEGTTSTTQERERVGAYLALPFRADQVTQGKGGDSMGETQALTITLSGEGGKGEREREEGDQSESELDPETERELREELASLERDLVDLQVRLRDAKDTRRNAPAAKRRSEIMTTITQSTVSDDEYTRLI
ncbi:actin-related protein 5, partial [Kipferlia bialata]|eukprot:g11179.t1